MKNISIKSIIKKDGENFVIIPVTQADKITLGIFADENKENYITVDLKNTVSTKTYTQLKTAWALITVLFEANYYRKPTKNELQEFHDELLNDYADKKPSLLHSGELKPITLREMSVRQMSSFIQTLITILAEDCELTDTEQITAKNVFCEWQNYMSSLKQDPRDFDSDGNIISIDKWREQHTVSFASGRTATDEVQLDLAHIISRGADEAHRDCCWNTMILTHEEHMLQHQIGWEEFLKLYPHLRGRVERARQLALSED